MSSAVTPSTGNESSGTPTLPLPPIMPGKARVRMEVAGRTHVGNVRPNNEDHFLIARACKSLQVMSSSLPGDNRAAPPSEVEGYVLLVADGMGGHAGGERASAFVVEETKRYVLRSAKWFFRLDDPDETVRLRMLREELDRMDESLIAAAREDPALRGMGTTLTAACCVGLEVFLVAVGDSRAYVLCDQGLVQLTTDQTLAQELVERGQLTPEQARHHRAGKVLTNALGGSLGVRGEIGKVRVADGDRLLLCTDGLTDMVDDDRITDILRRHPRAADACNALVAAALAAGGRDNVTVVVAAYAVEAE
jgi:protein phosphatase